MDVVVAHQALADAGRLAIAQALLARDDPGLDVVADIADDLDRPTGWVGDVPVLVSLAREVR